MKSLHPETGAFTPRRVEQNVDILCPGCGEKKPKAYYRKKCVDCAEKETRARAKEWYQEDRRLHPEKYKTSGRPKGKDGWDKDLSLSMLTRKL